MSPSIPQPLFDRLVGLWHPEEVWLFGSRARGTSLPDSDWDLLLVVADDTRDEMLDLNEAWRQVRDLKLSVDLFPMRRSDFEAQRRHLGSLAQIATNEGSRIDAR